MSSTDRQALAEHSAEALFAQDRASQSLGMRIVAIAPQACTVTMNAAKSITGQIAPGSMPSVTVTVYVSGQGAVNGRHSSSSQASFQNCNQPFGGKDLRQLLDAAIGVIEQI